MKKNVTQQETEENVTVNQDEKTVNQESTETKVEKEQQVQDEKQEGKTDPEETEKEENVLLDDMVLQLKELQKQNSQLKDQYLRKQADFENYRKRMAKEKQEAIKYANNQLCGDLIEIIDNFERAIRSSEDAKDFENFHSGIVIIEKQFASMLESKWGLKRIIAQGAEFDPQFHEALMMEESSESEESMVLEVFQNGYVLNDRVLRPAKVKVSKPVEIKEENNNPE